MKNIYEWSLAKWKKKKQRRVDWSSITSVSMSLHAVKDRKEWMSLVYKRNWNGGHTPMQRRQLLKKIFFFGFSGYSFFSSYYFCFFDSVVVERPALWLSDLHSNRHLPPFQLRGKLIYISHNLWIQGLA